MGQTVVIFLSLVIALSGCSKKESEQGEEKAPWEVIKGRDTHGERTPIYRVRVPTHWIRHDCLPHTSIKDTTLALCEFLIVNGDAEHPIRIVLHNFPSESIQERISPRAQVARWEKQQGVAETKLKSIAFNGFTGLFFQAEGHDKMVLGWALQLPLEHYNALTPKGHMQPEFVQKRADVTIKATGPLKAMEEAYQEITRFAETFELIEEIPARP